MKKVTKVTFKYKNFVFKNNKIKSLLELYRKL